LKGKKKMENKVLQKRMLVQNQYSKLVRTYSGELWLRTKTIKDAQKGE